MVWVHDQHIAIPCGIKRLMLAGSRLKRLSASSHCEFGGRGEVAFIDDRDVIPRLR